MTQIPPGGSGSPASAHDRAAEQFAAHRRKLFAIAHRSLGSPWSADDAVQETWLRWNRADRDAIDNVDAWLTTVVSRVCIDMVRRQVGRHEVPDPEGTEVAGTPGAASADDPAESALRSDDLALAMQVVLDSLGPCERLALVLHDVFSVPYDDIAPIVERSPVASRQLASRARARLRTVDVAAVRERRRGAITAFLDAARGGDFGGGSCSCWIREIELRSDPAAVETSRAGEGHGAPLLAEQVRGADAVARVFAGRADLAQGVLIDGIPSAAYLPDGEEIRAVYLIDVAADRIVRIDVVADPEHVLAWSAESCVRVLQS